MKKGWHNDTPVDDSDPFIQARQFFGFDPNEDVDIILLRSRKFTKDKKAKTEAERQEIDRHFEILGGKVTRKPTPPPPPPAKPPEDPPEPAVAAPVEHKAPPPVSLPGELSSDELAPEEAERRRRLSDQIASLGRLVHRLRKAAVIDGTVGLMNQIKSGVIKINHTLGSDARFITNEQREQILELMGYLSTRSIVGSIYWGEYPSVIAPLINAKRDIYRTLRAEVPLGHEHLTRPANANGYIQ